MPAFSIGAGIIGAGGANAAGGASGAAGWQAYNNALQAASANKALASPYLFAGYAGTNALLKALGLGHLNPMNTDGGTMSTAYGETSLNTSDVGLDRENALKDFQASPGYQFRLGEGVKALDRSAAAKGNLFSGAQGKAITDYGQNLASDEWGNYLNRLSGLSGTGAGVATNTNSANSGVMTAGNNALFQGEMGRAASYSNAANALASGISSGVNNAFSLVKPFKIF